MKIMLKNMARKIGKRKETGEEEKRKEGRKETETGNTNLSSIYTSVKYSPLSVQKTKQKGITLS